jgi:PBP1b-binding outer membrane lipoprotein LpoB
MKNLVKVSIFALALGFFASCSESEAPAPETTPETTAAPAPETTAAPAPGGDTATAPEATTAPVDSAAKHN